MRICAENINYNAVRMIKDLLEARYDLIEEKYRKEREIDDSD